MGVVADAVARIERRRPREGRAGPRPGRHRRPSPSTSAGRCAGSPRTTRPAGPSTSTACSAPRRRCWSAASAAWSPRACWPAPSGVPATTTRDLALAATLARSSKDLEEHEYAVRSVADALDPHCSSMNVPEAPFVLHLPNVMHLATDVAGVVHDADTVSSLQLAEALHPSAAVGGTPTEIAVAADRRDRGHGPRPVRRAGRLDGRHRRRRVGDRAALRRSSTARRSGCSPAAASSRTPTPRPSSPRPRPSSSRSATRCPSPPRPPARRRDSPRGSAPTARRRGGPCPGRPSAPRLPT